MTFRRALHALFGFAIVGLLGVRARGDVPAAHNAETANVPPELEDVGVDEKMDAELPKDATFKDEAGHVVTLGKYFDGKRPVLLVFAYHTCKTLCSLVQSAVLDTVREQTWSVGKEFEIVTLSVDSHDTVANAADKKKAMIGSYGRTSADAGWHFLVGNDQNIHLVTDAAGWKFRRDPNGEIAHQAAILLVKPNGHIARYLYGIEYPANDVRIGLLEASEGRSISTVERILLYCYHYDPHERKYALLATHVMQVGGGLTLLLLGSFIGAMWLSERRKSKTRLETRSSSTVLTHANKT